MAERPCRKSPMRWPRGALLTLTLSTILTALGRLILIHAIRPAVTLLFGSRGPAAIFGRVRSAVVDAIQRVARRPLTHIAAKLCEVINPLFADRDASTAPIRIARIPRIKATLLHARPYAIEGCVPACRVAGAAVRDRPPPAPTATGHRRARAKLVLIHVGKRSAFAAAAPNPLAKYANFAPSAVEGFR